MKLPEIIALKISVYIVACLLKALGYKERSYTKPQCMGNPEGREEQFLNIKRLREEFISQGLPVLSIDTKKKEKLGNFRPSGKFYGSEKRKVYDHDYESFATGTAVPHGIYDTGRNVGYITIGTGKDTSEFVCDNLEWCWVTHLKNLYPGAKKILLVCDGGGSNSSRHIIFKQDLAKLASRLGLEIVVAHYPAYCSKWNPIEHRLFCAVHRAFEGAVLSSHKLVKELAESASTKTGLRVVARINDKVYETARKYNTYFKEHIAEYIEYGAKLPRNNYAVKCRDAAEIIF